MPLQVNDVEIVEGGICSRRPLYKNLKIMAATKWMIFNTKEEICTMRLDGGIRKSK